MNPTRHRHHYSLNTGERRVTICVRLRGGDLVYMSWTDRHSLSLSFSHSQDITKGEGRFNGVSLLFLSLRPISVFCLNVCLSVCVHMFNMKKGDVFLLFFCACSSCLLNMCSAVLFWFQREDLGRIWSSSSVWWLISVCRSVYVYIHMSARGSN